MAHPGALSTHQSVSDHIQARALLANLLRVEVQVIDILQHSKMPQYMSTWQPFYGGVFLTCFPQSATASQLSLGHLISALAHCLPSQQSRCRFQRSASELACWRLFEA